MQKSWKGKEKKQIKAKFSRNIYFKIFHPNAFWCLGANSICLNFLAFSSFMHENIEKAYFYQHLEFAAPKSWSKYTTDISKTAILLLRRKRGLIWGLGCFTYSVKGILLHLDKSWLWWLKLKSKIILCLVEKIAYWECFELYLIRVNFNSMSFAFSLMWQEWLFTQWGIH